MGEELEIHTSILIVLKKIVHDSKILNALICIKAKAFNKLKGKD